ncbi:MAG: 3-oxoacyl-[acyl-carrier-protein] reductase [Gemmatimonadota bacterium]|nr:MAG: 3-oxoacyl-[acyl-carrier-protein] reductase [Gemmatimonadota bacterium]
MTSEGLHDRDPCSKRGAGDPDYEETVTAAAEPLGDAVEQLLDQVGAETHAQPAFHRGGLRGRVAIVTGGSSGIGRAVALDLARSGVDVAFNFLDTGAEEREEAMRVVRQLRELEVNVFCRACDVRDPNQVRDFVAAAVEELGGAHILVNNAGIGRDRAVWHMSDEEWRSVLDTNLSGVFHTTREVAPYMRAQEWGKIVNVTSVHGLRSEFGLANYSASKAGIIGFTRSTAVELGPKNINVNAVAPGYIRTTRLTARVPSEILDRARERSVLGRLGDPQDVAGVVLFLCSEVARHITGAVIPIDGGYLL